MQKKLVIIAAGGTGSRLNNTLPKQFMLLNNKPVLMHTIERFHGIVDRIIVSIHPNMISYWKNLCTEHQFSDKHELVSGGQTRFQSVKNALNYYHQSKPTAEEFDNTIIAVHDAARPLIDQQLIKHSFELSGEGICTSLAVKSTNSIRIGTGTNSKSIDRESVWLIQTPQTFPAPIITKAYEQKEDMLFTDDCSVVEQLGYPIKLIESTPKNIKITYPEDFKVAEIYLKETYV